ncbi:MAG TPA: rhomboid family intramembrane serine protease [Beijerinckiaceae bacterium]|nr:rhomboid family intramembrane serine protease [Beijerinckiaceae bacterium]
MFLPIYDGVPLKHLEAPVATRGLVAVCIVAYLLTVFGLVYVHEEWFFAGLGLTPAVLFGYEAPAGLPVPTHLTLVTSIFLHGSILHLGSNMLFLWVFGDNVEDAMGHLRFLVFFVLCGIAAGLAHAWMDPESTRPLIGASGAVSGVVAAYLLLYPRVKIWGLFLKGIPLRLPAYFAIGFWILLQLLAAFFGGDDNVGWFAHLGGLVAGAVLVPLMRRRYDPVIARLKMGPAPPA